MARTLKTYITSQGFFERAVAPPSMKAALEAWESNPNFFQKGFARETDDPAIIAATMAAPGVVLERPVGSTGAFKQHAKLPRSLPANKPVKGPSKQKSHRVDKQTKTDGKTVYKRDRDAIRTAEREEKQKEKQRLKQEAQLKRVAEKCEAAIAKANRTLERSEQKHETHLDELKAQRKTIDDKIDVTEAKWEKEHKRLEEAVRKLDSTPLGDAATRRELAEGLTTRTSGSVMYLSEMARRSNHNR